MRVFVTGGAGFIGSAVCRHLAGDLGIHVMNMDKLTYAANLNSLTSLATNHRYSFLHEDICNREAVTAAFERFRPTAVVHLAAESHVDRSIADASQFIQTNICGTHVLLEAARCYWQDWRERTSISFACCTCLPTKFMAHSAK